MATQVRPFPALGRGVAAPDSLPRLRAAGVVLGLGLGGFVDGIVFHMLLQWHHLVCLNCGSSEQTTAEIRREVFSDGLFHALTWALVVAGLYMLWGAVRNAPARRPPRFLTGALLLGWGIFNVVEGVIDHHLLGIHHVRPGPDQAIWDLGFLASGVLLGLGGLALLRSSRPV